MDLLLILVELLTIPVSTFFSKFIIYESAQNMLLHCTFWSLKKKCWFFFFSYNTVIKPIMPGVLCYGGRWILIKMVAKIDWNSTVIHGTIEHAVP